MSLFKYILLICQSLEFRSILWALNIQDHPIIYLFDYLDDDGVITYGFGCSVIDLADDWSQELHPGLEEYYEI